MRLANALVITSTAACSPALAPRAAAHAAGADRAAWPVQVHGSADPPAKNSGRMARTFSGNKDAEPVQPVRSASTEAGIVGVCAGNASTPVALDKARSPVIDDCVKNIGDPVGHVCPAEQQGVTGGELHAAAVQVPEEYS